MIIEGWGRYPKINSSIVDSYSNNYSFIPTGNFRSYGDAALSENYLSSLTNNHFINFDEKTGLLTCDSGVLLSDVINTFIPRGWFLAITPGTKLITIGGAVAADVHGKNHHLEGCFSECVDSFHLQLPDKVILCSRSQNSTLFKATCGGMGLTGIIKQVSFYLKPINSQWVKQTTIKNHNLIETFSAFESNSHSPYSVGWIDCLAKGKNFGRSLLMLGKFNDDGDLNYHNKLRISIPSYFPSFSLNYITTKAFNAIYFNKAKDRPSEQIVGIDSFFYPLDKFSHWNRIYGKEGFIQFQFIIPKKQSFEGLTEILNRIAKKGFGSFLAVLKLYGPKNKNWLSFPIEGYSLALDFKMQPKLFEFISLLTDLVVELGGRVYLAKDALLTEKQFNLSYENAERFRKLRNDLNLDNSIQSLLSKRLNL